MDIHPDRGVAGVIAQGVPDMGPHLRGIQARAEQLTLAEMACIFKRLNDGNYHPDLDE